MRPPQRLWMLLTQCDTILIILTMPLCWIYLIKSLTFYTAGVRPRMAMPPRRGMGVRPTMPGRLQPPMAPMQQPVRCRIYNKFYYLLINEVLLYVTSL